MATPNAAFDIADFVDFGEVGMSQVSGTQETALIEPKTPLDENYPHYQNYEPPVHLSNAQPTSAEFNTDFSSWLPRYQKPAQPCEYCRSRSLECFMYSTDGSKESGCSPCNALFRVCSFSASDKMLSMKKRGALDTLDVVAETETRCFGGLTGKKQMRSLGHVGPIEDENEGEGPKKGASAVRFPRTAVKVLKDWMLMHIDHPYPSDEEKETLKQQTGLSIGQISNWMANTRRREKARTKRSASPSIRPSTEAMDIPKGTTWELMNPLERWKHSPPENEPAPLTAIQHAVETFDPLESVSLSSSYRKDASNDSTGSFSVFKAPSISSLETGLTNISSGSHGSHNSAYSYGSRHSLGSMNSLKSKERRRRRRIPMRVSKASPDDGPRMFQCTFCTDTFKSKHDWSRHEKSLHLSLEKWLCAPLGEIVADKATGMPKCVYCDAIDPSKEHLATHNHSACLEKGKESRTFYRKDHLRQHLRLIHGCKMTATMETWKSEAQYIKSRCGFCGMNFDKWQDRVDHLAKEFRNGANMKNWKGCRGLDAHVAIYVTNAMPPYLIANESKSPFPFSASNSASIKQNTFSLENKDLEYLLPTPNDKHQSSDLSIAYQDQHDSSDIGPIALTTPKHYTQSQHVNPDPNATCWEILTLRLGRYARQQIEKDGSGSITDAMLQSEARKILYDDDDPWNYTSADNPEWLTLFKKAHGIDCTPLVPGLEAHSVYEDLGIHSHTTLDPSFNVDFSCATLPPNDPLRALSFEVSLSGSSDVYRHARQVSSGLQSPYSVPGLTGTSASPGSFAPVTTSEQMLGVYEPISELVCTSTGKQCYGENGELGFSTSIAGSHKKRYWLDENTAHMAPFSPAKATQQPVYECPTVGLRSFEPIDQQACAAASEHDFQFPSWDQLPEELQNPTSSAGFDSMAQVTTAGGETVMPWDDTEMGFAMDMDMDLDLDVELGALERR